MNTNESAENYLLDCSSEHGRCSLPAFLGQGLKRLRMRSKTGSIAVNLALALINVIASVIPVQFISDVLASVSVFDRYYEFTTGIFSLGNVIFFVSVIVIFMFLTVRILEKRRWA